MFHRVVTTLTADVVAVPALGRPGRLWIHRTPFAPVGVLVTSAMAWAVLVGGEVTGGSRYLHHDALLAGGAPRWSALAVFLVGWVAMVAAMMLPTTLPALQPVVGGAGGAAPGAVRAFCGAFVGAWVPVGLLALGLDAVCHRVVEGVPALAARPESVAVVVLAAAGVLQLTPSTRRRQTATAGHVGVGAASWTGGTSGWEHGLRCIVADGPLMLVGFAAGGQLGWMAVLTGVMVAERSSRVGRLVAALAGVLLVVAAVFVAFGPAWAQRPFGSAD
jgi:predicted metal-binding membrane protein